MYIDMPLRPVILTMSEGLDSDSDSYCYVFRHKTPKPRKTAGAVSGTRQTYRALAWNAAVQVTGRREMLAFAGKA